MWSRITVPAVAMAACLTAHAEVKGFFGVDAGAAHRTGSANFYYSADAGIQFNDHVEIEVGYHDFGDTGVLGTEVTSYSAGLNIGGRISAGTRLFAVLGVEKLDTEEVQSPFGFSFTSDDESDNQGFFGIGLAFDINPNVAVRSRLVSHQKTDINTLNIGFAFYF